MIQKHELPILEYDSNSEEVIRPNHGAEQLKLPEKCVYAFLGEAVDDYAFEAEATVAETFETITRNYPVYIVKQDGMEFCLCAAPLGAPAAAQLMDFLISCGCKKIISTGSCGVLTDLAENEFLIPVKALRDEGTSYHYLPASRYLYRTQQKYPGCHRAYSSCAEHSVPGVCYMDNGRVLPGNTGYGRISQIRGLFHS